MEVGRGSVIVGGHGREELGAGKRESCLKFGHLSLLHAQHFISKLFLQLLVQTLINADRMQDKAESQQSVHLLVLLVDLVIEVLKGLLGALNVGQHVSEGAYRILVPPHHHVSKADVVQCGDLAGWHQGVHVLLVHIDVLHDLQGLVVVAQ